LVAYKIAE